MTGVPINAPTAAGPGIPANNASGQAGIVDGNNKGDLTPAHLQGETPEPLMEETPYLTGETPS